ncbi:hypothetical protein [Nocardia abscessus]|uniref:hypothetical protein n=1 Tax=Nocardia abscessus TaxID=120957 RepID=UPI00245909DE|nr:hypothetical protein [Nocardia abscessus]
MPVWFLTVDVSDVFHKDMPYKEKRSRIVEILRESKWYSDDYAELVEVIDALSEAPTVYEFDFYWNHLYDLADEDRIWIKTW